MSAAVVSPVRVRRLIRLTVLRLQQEVLEWAGARWFLLTLVVQAVMGPLIGLFVWSAVFPADPFVANYYVALLVITLLTESFEQHTFSTKIYDGTLSHDLLRPQPVVISTLGSNIAIRIWLGVIGAPIVILTALAVQVSFAWQAVLLAIPALALAALLIFLWTFILSLTAFWTERVHAVVGLGSTLMTLLGGTVAPLKFMPEPWRTLGEGLPFYAMLGLPAEIATGQVDSADVWAGLGFQLVWIVVLIMIAVALWRRGVRRYTAVGA